MENKIFILCGSGGAGKTTIIENLAKSKNLFRIFSCTTRKRRPFEKENDYKFLEEKEFLEKLKKGDFLEYNKFLGFYYGTEKREVEDKLKKGNVLMILDPKSASSVKREGIFKNCITIFLKTDLDTLTLRLKNRGDDLSQIKKKINLNKENLKLLKKFDYVINSNDILGAVEEIKGIIKQLQ